MRLKKNKNVNGNSCFGQRQSESNRCKGAAIIELAVCLPILVLVTLATIEACAMLYLKQTLTIAAFEGARLGVIQGSQALNVEAQSQLILIDHGVASYAISMEPADPSTLTAGDYFRVSVSAECSPNSLIGGWFYTGKTFTESVELAFH
jgi:hypothetical protein